MTEDISPDDMGRALVPSMEDVEAVPDNGLRVVSTFTGCGGSCLGFRWAGYRPLWASEFVEAAREVYELNHPGVPVDPRDIRNVTPEEILDEAGMAKGECDVVEGSPPCASFSTAGKRESTWGEERKYSETTQRVDDLLFEFVRIVEGVAPKVFVAENVKGLVTGKAKGYFKQIYEAMEDAGYSVSCRVLDAAYFGVPQHRRRTIFVGVREDLDAEPSHPKPQTDPVPLKRVLPYIYKTGANPSFGKEEWQDNRSPVQTIGTTPNTGNGLSPSGMCEAASMEGYAVGDEWENLAPGEQSEKYFQLIRCALDEPVPTVPQSGGNPAAASPSHPTEKRKFTMPELKRICGFPDDFELTGTFAQQWERLGRAVPPPMMMGIAAHVRDHILQGDTDG